MTRKYIIPERLVPSELDLGDPLQKEEYDCHAEKYRFAAMFTEGKHVLDVACGSGYGSAILFEKGRSATVTGVDIDEGTIKRAMREYQAGNILFLRAAFDEIDPGKQYDVVVSINTLEYMRNPCYFIEYIRNLLVPAGDLIISVHTTPTTDFNPYTRHDISRARLMRMLKKTGFITEQEFWQIKKFSVPGALDLMKHKKGVKTDSYHNRSLPVFYARHPLKALRRMKSLLTDGFTVKTLTVRARLP